jgi:trans-2,3-dihydro-3-hydroxyanthranilate isomerase
MDKDLKTYQITYIDAFTATRYSGNPCAVLPRAEGLEDAQMQAIARETNLNETAFVFSSDLADFRVRYFTPVHEIPFAGHPTIATAFMLAQAGRIALVEPLTRINFEFNIGVLPVDIIVEHGQPAQVVMTQPAPVFGAEVPVTALAPCFGLQLSDLRSDCPPQVVSTGVPFLIVPAMNVDVLGRVKMDREPLARLLKGVGVGAAFMFCLGGFAPEADTHARLFSPQGGSEDPYTGSATGALACYTIHHGLKSGPCLTAEQGHFVHRPGMGQAEIIGSSTDMQGVRLGGAAVKVLEGTIYV